MLILDANSDDQMMKAQSNWKNIGSKVGEDKHRLPDNLSWSMSVRIQPLEGRVGPYLLQLLRSLLLKGLFCCLQGQVHLVALQQGLGLVHNTQPVCLPFTSARPSATATFCWDR